MQAPTIRNRRCFDGRSASEYKGGRRHGKEAVSKEASGKEALQLSLPAGQKERKKLLTLRHNVAPP